MGTLTGCRDDYIDYSRGNRVIVQREENDPTPPGPRGSKNRILSLQYQTDLPWARLVAGVRRGSAVRSNQDNISGGNGSESEKILGRDREGSLWSVSEFKDWPWSTGNLMSQCITHQFGDAVELHFFHQIGLMGTDCLIADE